MVSVPEASTINSIMQQAREFEEIPNTLWFKTEHAAKLNLPKNTFEQTPTHLSMNQILKCAEEVQEFVISMPSVQPLPIEGSARHGEGGRGWAPHEAEGSASQRAESSGACCC